MDNIFVFKFDNRSNKYLHEKTFIINFKPFPDWYFDYIKYIYLSTHQMLMLRYVYCIYIY